MTADAWAQLAPPAPSTDQLVKRDRYGRYLVRNPATGREQAWTRATTIANTLADRYGLEQWVKRNVVLGIGARVDLQHLAASCTPDDKKQLNDIVRQAEDAAAGKAGANSGTALHRLTERADSGEDVRVGDPSLAADLATYLQAMAAAGIRVARDPGTGRSWIERVLIVPELDGAGVAGTCDRVCMAEGWPLPRIADLKTGKDVLKFGMDSIPLQLAIYAHASHWFDPATGELHPMPPVDQERAVVMHLPVGQARCTLIEVDIAAGWEAVQLAVAVRAWRKRDDLAHVISTPAPPALSGAVAGASAAAGVMAQPPGDGPATATPEGKAAPPPAAPSPADSPAVLAATVAWVRGEAAEKLTNPVADITPADDATVAWLRRRVMAILEGGHEAVLAGAWPDSCPTLRQGGLTRHHAAALDATCSAVEGFYEMALAHPTPAQAPAGAGSAPAAEPVAPGPTLGEEARPLAERARALLDGFDEPARLAIAECALVGNDRMTADRLDRLEAVATQCADVHGATHLLYGPDVDVALVAPTADAADRMAAASGTGFGKGKANALARAKRLAKALGLPAPRSLAIAAESALLAALVAAGRGAETTNDTQEGTAT